MVSGIPQSELISAAGAPTDPGALARAMGPGWRGGYVGAEQLDKVMGLGRPWVAEFYESGKLGHFVVVEGRQGTNFLIRDPAGGGSTYEMAAGEFHRVWTGRAVLR
jgi:ABC-type bacteriocin/lantibiotic exporter with double-glycine peptidase domain